MGKYMEPTQGFKVVSDGKRETVYRPGLNSDLTDHNSKSDICSFYPSKQGNFSSVMRLLDRPWQKIGADVFTLDGADYLCVADYCSSYFEVNRI